MTAETPRSNNRGEVFAQSLRTTLERLGESPIGALPLPTLGGKQLWFDRLVFAGWRIQENVISGHCRLLDAGDIRRAWGSFGHCLARFRWFRIHRRLHHSQDHTVVMVHGLLRAHGMFTRLRGWLADRNVEAIAFNYASARLSLGEHARALVEVLSHLDDISAVTFVTYSLGALVVRRALADGGPWRDKIAVRGMFMVGPPNRGARLAEVMLKGGLMGRLAEPVAADLMPAQVAALPPPDVRYAIVAGGTGRTFGFNPLLEGDNDGFVTLAEARLSPSDDFLLVHATHGLLVNHPATRRALGRFLSGQKIAAGPR